ncbi:NAD(P)/FAD-dependent oxidoreductase [Pseudoduganella sp. SL102]|uniref:NAD(P)/FAD-dependent oxidoreductase n=1 Tax=Pseudoduganella sp. SL102 TaxID=2995154 RepID=UPI00248C8A01|nr:NAD(P)/FAD-dependent oxidoreductase [Pseudoduganella sp. SL102]WBS05720.1 NAD(P)/FAD-dependent oxidoreductase [Pseudoduganella sp. SL102]
MMFDAIIVGGSFAGLSAALQLARARRSVLLVDAGQPRNRFAATAHGFLGHDGKPPQQIRAEAREQLARYPTVTFADGSATAATRAGDGFVVEIEGTGGQRQEHGRRLVLSTGVRDELPDLPGLAERWGSTVIHCPYCHGYEVAGSTLGILGGDAMAAHKAALIADWGPAILFTQGGEEPATEQAALLAARGVAIERVPVAALLGNTPDLDGVRLADGRVVTLGALFVSPGAKPASPLAGQLGCAFDEGPFGPYVRVDERKQTTVPGVFAAGDAATPMHSATLASAAGVLAGVHAHQSLVFG